MINTLRLRQNSRHFSDDTFRCIFLNKNVWISINISPKLVLKGPINNIPALVQIMAWRRSGDKPLSEPRMVSLLTHICVTRPQWFNPCSAVFIYLHFLSFCQTNWISEWVIKFNSLSWTANSEVHVIHISLTTPNQYIDQCWQIIIEDLWHSRFTWERLHSYVYPKLLLVFCKMSMQIIFFKFLPHLSSINFNNPAPNICHGWYTILTKTNISSKQPHMGGADLVNWIQHMLEHPA